MKGCLLADRDTAMNAEEKMQSSLLPSVKELRAAREESMSSDAVTQLLTLFDEGTFVEIGGYTRRKYPLYPGVDGGFEGVICGYGAVDGALVFAFAQDSARTGAALDEMHAKKIVSLYDMALRAGAPVIGIFDTEGADIRDGASPLAAYGSIIHAVSSAKGQIPQIALILGKCRGLFAAIASMFDFKIREKDAVFGVGECDKEPLWASVSQNRFDGISYIRDLLSYIPQNNRMGVEAQESADSLNRRVPIPEDKSDVGAVIAAIADNGMALEVYASAATEVKTAFLRIGGMLSAVVAPIPSQDRGKLTYKGVKKMTAFLGFCSRFSIPIVSLIDSAGLSSEESSSSFAEALGELASVYTSAKVPKIAVIMGKAIGASAVLLGSHELGTDMVFAVDTAEIGILPTASAVAFAWNDRITADRSREEWENEWRRSFASPVAAAALGAVDDIIMVRELRKKIASAILMLAPDGTAVYSKAKGGEC